MAYQKNDSFGNHQFQATAIVLINIVGIKATDVAEALCMAPIPLYRRRTELDVPSE